MLIRFSVENFRSFRERAYLSFVPAEGEHSHPEHVVPAKMPDGFPLLKLAVLYGANA
jgi:AAA15 family ATPase/GTPase